MAENKKSFLIYCDIINTIDHLTDSEKGKLFQHLLEYVNDMNPVMEDRLLLGSWKPIEQQLKRDLKKYEATCNRNSKNGAKGGRPKKQEEPKKPSGLIGNPVEPKKADTDTDTDNDIDKDNVKDIILNNKSWIEQICMQKRKDYRVIYNYLNGFLDNLILQGEIDKGEKEIKKHFINWLKIELSKNSSKSNNATSKIVF